MRALFLACLCVAPVMAQDAAPPALINELPVERYAVDVACDGSIATVVVEETFYNPGARMAEADFLFPLELGAAASGLELQMAGSFFGGNMLPRSRARDIYDRITRRSRDPALLECVGKDLYRCRVFPVPGRGNAAVRFSYRQPLAAEGNMRRLVIPLDVARFNRTPVKEFALSIRLETEAGLQAIFCPTHDVAIRHRGAREAYVQLEAADAYLAKDLVLLFAVEDAPLGVVASSYRHWGEAGYFVLSIDAAFARAAQEQAPRDVVVAVDTSASTGVFGLEAAAAAVGEAVQALRPRDRYALVSFATEPRVLADFRHPDGATAAEVRALLAAQPLAGKTRLAAAVLGAVELAEGGQPGTGIVLVTDGGDPDVERAWTAARGAAEQGHRVGACGVGREVDAVALDVIGEQGRGDSAYGSHRLAEDIGYLLEATKAVPITDIEVDVEGVSQVYPECVRLVQAGDTILVAGRYTRPGPVDVRVRGQVGGEPVETVLRVDLRERGGDPAIARLWAARRVGHLLDEARRAGDPERHRAEIRRLGERFGIVTPHTALLVLEQEDQQRMLKGMRRTPLLQSAGGSLRERPAYTSAVAATDVAHRIRQLCRAQSGDVNPFEDLLGKNRLRMRHVDDRTFYRGDDGTWIESELVLREPAGPRVVTFLSEEWHALAADEDAAGPLALGRAVLFRLADGTAVRVVEE